MKIPLYCFTHFIYNLVLRNKFVVHVHQEYPRVDSTVQLGWGWAASHMEVTGMLVGNFKLHGDQSGCGSSLF